MAIYVMSDIHGCYDEFKQMLGRIDMSGDDRLILAGDYIDRGPKSLEMLKWLEDKPGNVTLIKGNHDVEFAGYVRLLEQIDKKNDLMTDPDSNEDLQMLLDTAGYMFKQRSPLGLLYFDYYGTVTDFITNKGVTLREMLKWADMIDGWPYYERFEAAGRDCIVVHAGFCEDENLLKDSNTSLNEFCLYAREEYLDIGGIPKGMIIAGHTPTIIEESRFYNDGEVFRYYDPDKDCIFYDIDCGCVFYETFPSGTLACLRVDDEEIFYL